MLDGLVGRVFEVMRPNDVFRCRFTVTAVNGHMASIVTAENHPSTVTVWSVMRCLHTGTIRAEVPAPSSPLPTRTPKLGQSGNPPRVHYRCEDCGHVSSRALNDE